LKSQLLALIASYIAFLSDEQEEVYIGATTREQSQIVYGEIVAQLDRVKVLKGKYKEAYGKVTHLKSKSIIQPLSKEAKKSGDGKNPSVGIIDEYHQHPDDGIYETLKTGMVARGEPLLVIITTAGMDLDSPCYTEYKYVSRILDPNDPITNEEYFVMICELEKGDDIKDERNWIKANPIVATYPEGLKAIRDDLKIALEVEEKMTAFLTKNMNIWVQAKANGYMNLEKWNECAVKDGEDIPDLFNKEVYIGIDLSAKIDLTSIGILVPIGDEKFFAMQHSFIPEDTLSTKMATDKVPYDLWIRKGWLTTTSGAVVDYRYIQKHIDDLVAKYNWEAQGIYYDPYNATQFINEAMDKGYIAEEVRQGVQTLSSPTKSFRELVYQKQIVHDGDELLAWTLGNAVTRKDHNENIMLDKNKSTKRIDPIASLVNAHTQAMYHYQDTSISYSDDDLDKYGW
jgi:phage terminase large subunit-like protein